MAGRRQGVGAVLALLAAWPLPARTGELALLLEGSLEIEDERVFAAPDPEAELNDLRATLDLDAAAVRPDGSGLYATAVLEPVRDPDSDRAFGDTGVYFEEVFLQVALGPAELRAGKIGPVFGLIEAREPGLYGDELAGDYELSERIGLEASLPFQALGGEHVLTAATFVADRTPLSGALFTSRERLRRRDGGVSNTARPGSFALSAAGEFGDTAYSAGVRVQSAGRGDEADEQGAVFGLARETEVFDTALVLAAEAAHFPRFDGERESASFLTVGSEVALGPAWLTLYAGLRDGTGAPADRLATLAVEVPIGEVLAFAAAYRFLEEEGAPTHALGLRLTYEFGLP